MTEYERTMKCSNCEEEIYTREDVFKIDGNVFCPECFHEWLSDMDDTELLYKLGGEHAWDNTQEWLDNDRYCHYDD